MVLIPLSIQNVYSPAGTVPLPSHLTSYTPTKPHLYLDRSVETVFRESALYKLLMFHVPNLVSILRRLGRLYKNPPKLEALVVSVTCLFFTVRVVSPTLNLQAGGPPLVVCPRLFIQYILSYSPRLEAVPPSALLR
jgi:hypothetical protein